MPDNVVFKEISRNYPDCIDTPAKSWFGVQERRVDSVTQRNRVDPLWEVFPRCAGGPSRKGQRCTNMIGVCEEAVWHLTEVDREIVQCEPNNAGSAEAIRCANQD